MYLSLSLVDSLIFSRCTHSPSSCCLYRPGQEAGNIPFVENSGFGKYSGDPTEIADTVSSWLANPGVLQSMHQAALKASRPHATLDIAKDLAEIAFKEKEKQKIEQRELFFIK